MPGPSLEVVTPPAAEPVTLAELKAHLRIDWDDEDAALAGFLTAAREQFERRAGRAVLPTQVRERFAGWPPGRRLPLSAAPALSVQAVSYRDAGDAEQVLAGWAGETPADPAVVLLPDGLALPPLSPARLRPVSVAYTAGWPTAAAVPEIVKVAIKLLAGHYYACREAYQAGPEGRPVAMGFQAVCDQFWTGLTWGA
jgi:uncharacterized phiE125 gp8 family phage protein